MINTVLFDLDGTLLPFEQEEFIKMYFQLLCRELAPRGYDPDAVVKAVWGGTKEMIRNDGTVLNHQRFWDTFAAVLGEDVRQSEQTLDAFYTTAFNTIKTVLRGDSPAKMIVDTLREKGYTVVLATNPLFPKVAQLTRMSWVGLSQSDFDHITHYQNSHYCKPSPKYYEEILEVIGKTPEECLMIGNSVSEDMIPASSLGMSVHLVTGFVENPDNADITCYAQSPLSDVISLVRALPTA